MKQEYSVQMVLSLLYEKYFASSKMRPWIRGDMAARQDALYRLTVLLSSPLLVVAGIVGLLLRRFGVANFSVQVIGLVVGAVVLSVLAGVYAVLSRKTRHVHTSIRRNHVSAVSDVPVRLLEWFCYLSVVALAVVLYFLGP
jgi:hypothetical protein